MTVVESAVTWSSAPRVHLAGAPDTPPASPLVDCMCMRSGLGLAHEHIVEYFNRTRSKAVHTTTRGTVTTTGNQPRPSSTDMRTPCPAPPCIEPLRPGGR